MELLAPDRKEHAALPDLGDLVVVRVHVPAGERPGVDDQALEDAGALVHHHVLDDADARTGRVVDGRAVLKRERRDRGAEVVHRLSQ